MSPKAFAMIMAILLEIIDQLAAKGVLDSSEIMDLVELAMRET